MTDRELMQMALDALDCIYSPLHVREINKVGGAIKALRARLAQPEPEPVSMDSDKVICPSCCHQFRAIPVNVQQLMIDAGFRPPFTAPPQREWQGLTDEERYLNEARSAEEIEYAKAIEAKLKEKNT